MLCGLSSLALVQRHLGIPQFLPKMLASELNTHTHLTAFTAFTPDCVYSQHSKRQVIEEAIWVMYMINSYFAYNVMRKESAISSG